MKSLNLFLTTLLFTSSVIANPGTNTPLIITPESLRQTFLARNIDIAQALNEVQQAKAQVAQARGQLLPSINLGSIISSGPSFMLTSVSFLLPFLMPSKWMDLRESEQLLKAQGMSYHLAQLNGYAAAYSVYATIAGDIQLREVLHSQYETYKHIEDQLRLPAEIGIVPKEDYLQAQAQAQLALVQVSKLDELIKREMASIRHMLGLELEQEMRIEPHLTPASVAENGTPSSLLEKVHESSPETAQLNALIAAAQANQWSKTFAFLSGSSLGVNRPATGGAFGSVTQTGSLNLGFGYFPALEMSHLHLEQLRLRKIELKQDQAQLIEATLGALEEAQKQLMAASQAEENLRQVYAAEYLRYQVGMTSLLNVLQVGNSVSNAAINRVKALTAVDNLRISLHRLMITDEFSKIEKCEIERRSSGGLRGRLGRIFNPEKDKVSLDQACSVPARNQNLPY